MKNLISVKQFILVFFIITHHTFIVSGQSTEVISNFKDIEKEPLSISFKNSFDIPGNGGHLQGIQKLIYRESEYFFLSGSSDEYSYYTILKMADTSGIVISHNLILEKPLKHAGGFQVYNNLMAIGVEDNEEKNRSQVFIFQIENPEKPPEKPLAIIDRFGTAKRATAGCVAINQIGEKVLVIVGDWDSVNLDFYVISRELLGVDPNALILEYSVNSRKIEKTDWIDQEWRSYQNINLLQDSEGQIFLAGTATNSGGEDILDLYEIESTDFKTFALRKIYSRNFGSNPETKFRWGAGLYVSSNQLQVLSTPENILEQTIIHIYE